MQIVNLFELKNLPISSEYREIKILDFALTQHSIKCWIHR
ncbi:hypothetical protein CKA32_006992 [Geitlerinema sp. FC II]|nr:hypothetical protein CKA32_006992 [Geitlerinema sp. FC II]